MILGIGKSTFTKQLFHSQCDIFINIIWYLKNKCRLGIHLSILSIQLWWNPNTCFRNGKKMCSRSIFISFDINLSISSCLFLSMSAHRNTLNITSTVFLHLHINTRHWSHHKLSSNNLTLHHNNHNSYPPDPEIKFTIDQFHNSFYHTQSNNIRFQADNCRVRHWFHISHGKTRLSERQLYSRRCPVPRSIWMRPKRSQLDSRAPIRSVG